MQCGGFMSDLVENESKFAQIQSQSQIHPKILALRASLPLY